MSSPIPSLRDPGISGNRYHQQPKSYKASNSYENQQKFRKTFLKSPADVVLYQK